MNANTYYIERLEHNSINSNEYVYLDYVDGKLLIDDGKWFLDLNFYIINNFYLPINSFYLNLETPSKAIKNIKLVEIKTDNLPDNINDSNECSVYNSKFYLSTVDDPFFEQKLYEYLYELNFSFSINTDVFNNELSNINQTELNNFVNELEELDSSVEFKYSNFFSSNVSLSYNHVYGYLLNTKENGIKLYEPITFKMDNYDDYDKPIKDLLKISSSNKFQIVSAKINFYYSINENGIKNIEYADNDPKLPSNETIIKYDLKTKFDENNNEIINSFDGINGFFSPLKTIGYYQINLIISLNNSNIEYQFTNNFSFNNEIKQKNVEVKEVFIKNNSWMKKISFNG